MTNPRYFEEFASAVRFARKARAVHSLVSVSRRGYFYRVKLWPDDGRLPATWRTL